MNHYTRNMNPAGLEQKEHQSGKSKIAGFAARNQQFERGVQSTAQLSEFVIHFQTQRLERQGRRRRSAFAQPFFQNLVT